MLSVRLCCRYAALDAFVELPLYHEILSRQDPIFNPPRDLAVGDHVRLYIRGGSDCIGEGIVDDNGGEKFWGNTGISLVPRSRTRSGGRRWCVRLKEVLKPRTKAIVPDYNNQFTPIAAGKLVL